MIKKISLFFLLAVFSEILMAQENDFGIWFEVNTAFKLAKKVEANISGEMRTFNNSSQVHQVFLEGGLEYKVTKRFALAGSYRLASRREDDSYFYFRHRIFADLKLKYPVGNFNIAARLRMQRTTRTYIEDPEDIDAQYVCRFRLKTDYDVPKVPVAPFVYYESFSPVFSDQGFRISKYRIGTGAEYHLTKKSDLTAGYIYQHDTDPKLRITHALTLGYAIKF